MMVCSSRKRSSIAELPSAPRRAWDGTARPANSPQAFRARLDLSKYDLYETEDRVVESTTTLNNGQYLSGSAFGRWQKFAWQKVAFDVGARLDVIQYGSQDLQVTNAPMVHATTVQVSPKFGARYILSSKAALLASVARGFRGAPGVVTDPSLPPLSMWGIEVGTQLVFGGFTADLSLFRMDVANERIQDPVTLLILDTGASYRQGVSARLGWQATSRLSFQGKRHLEQCTHQGHRSGTGHARGRARGGTVQLDPTILFHLVPPEPGDPVPGVMDYNASLGGEYRSGAARWWGRGCASAGRSRRSASPTCRPSRTPCSISAASCRSGTQRADPRHRRAERHQHQVSGNPFQRLHQPRCSRRRSRRGELRDAVKHGVNPLQGEQYHEGSYAETHARHHRIRIHAVGLLGRRSARETRHAGIGEAVRCGDPHRAAQPYSLATGVTTRVEVHYYDADGDDISDELIAEHFTSLTFDPGTFATVSSVTDAKFQRDILVNVAIGGTAALTVGYGHDEAADSKSFGPYTVTATGAPAVRTARADAMIGASMKAAFLLASLVALSAAASPSGRGTTGW